MDARPASPTPIHIKLPLHLSTRLRLLKECAHKTRAFETILMQSVHTRRLTWPLVERPLETTLCSSIVVPGYTEIDFRTFGRRPFADSALHALPLAERDWMNRLLLQQVYFFSTPTCNAVSTSRKYIYFSASSASLPVRHRRGTKGLGVVSCPFENDIGAVIELLSNTQLHTKGKSFSSPFILYTVTGTEFFGSYACNSRSDPPSYLQPL